MHCSLSRRTLAQLAALALFASGVTCWAETNSLPALARQIRTDLVERIMPFWHDTTIDREHGSFILSKGPPVEKQLVTQSRMVWGFSHAKIKNLGDGKRDYLADAKQGYEFLLKHFLDAEHGGYFWTTDAEGKTLNPRKIVYGEAFVIYGFVEYFRASGDTQALANAMKLFTTLQERAHDKLHGGWVEHFQRDWTPILTSGPEAIVEVGGLKSANTHLHLMEAFTELYMETKDAAVRKALIESLEINQKYFYPADPAKSCFHRNPDWSFVTAPSSAGLSYGHNVEFAWLMVRAEKALGRNPSWRHFYAHVNHALKNGYDHARGGLYNRGVGDAPATDTDKVWWVQAEMLAALTDGLKNQSNPEHEHALTQLLDFTSRYMAAPGDGVWFDTVTADGKPKVPAKAHNWKANYHDVRALVKFIEAFGQK